MQKNREVRPLLVGVRLGHFSVFLLQHERIMPKLQPCQCSHGKTIHYPKSGREKLKSPCNFPDCMCPEYNPNSLPFLKKKTL
jgi:hypothetical protein